MLEAYAFTREDFPCSTHKSLMCGVLRNNMQICNNTTCFPLSYNTLCKKRERKSKGKREGVWERKREKNERKKGKRDWVEREGEIKGEGQGEEGRRVWGVREGVRELESEQEKEREGEKDSCPKKASESLLDDINWLGPEK